MTTPETVASSKDKEDGDGRPYGQPAGGLRAESLSGVSGGAAHQAHEVERVAAALWFELVDQQGYPSGLPTWNEMAGWPESDRNNRCHEFRSFARAAIAVLRPQPEEGAPWQPWSSVPGDGSWFEARTESGQRRIVRYASRFDRLPIGGDGEAWVTLPTEWRPI